MDSPTPADIALLEKAYNMAEEAHKGVLRKSGEPYFTHVFETARLLAEQALDRDKEWSVIFWIALHPTDPKLNRSDEKLKSSIKPQPPRLSHKKSWWKALNDK